MMCAAQSPTVVSTRRVHVFGEKWALVGNGYEAVWYKGSTSFFMMIATLLQAGVDTWRMSAPTWLGGKRQSSPSK